MCGDCGCETANQSFFPEETKTLHLGVEVLKENNRIAHDNHHWFHDHKLKVVNLMSSPGSGKTLLLEKTAKDFPTSSILVGDQQTNYDQDRLIKAGARAKQISTHGTCHLDAQMISKELGSFVTGEEDLLFIENVGNLVCPSAFDLGETHKVALLSVTEGEDKPEKYPVLFHQANVVVLTKVDLLPYLDWDEERFQNCLRKVNPNARVIRLSAKTGEGMEAWGDYLKTIERT